MSKIRILLVEDNRLLCEGIVSMVNEQADMRIVATLGTYEETLLKTSLVKPQVALVDFGLQNQHSLRMADLLTKEAPQLKVIGMGLIPSQPDIAGFVEAGASGFVLKDATADEVLATIRSVASGGKVLPPMLTHSLFSQVAEHGVKKGNGSLDTTARMTAREREIIALITEGLRNKEIAARLHIATHTVKSHVHNILEKLELQSRLQIARKNHEGAFG